MSHEPDAAPQVTNTLHTDLILKQPDLMLTAVDVTASSAPAVLKA
jgi:hypothetical protein